MPVSYETDVRPLFRPQDVACMKRGSVELSDRAWMCDAAAGHGHPDHGNARMVAERLEDGTMPPDGRWSDDKLGTYRQWAADGFHP